MQKLVITLSLICLLAVSYVFAVTGIGESDSGYLTSLPPDPPELSSPADATVDLSDAVTMVWHSQIHTSSYRIQIASTLDFSSPIVSKTVTDTSYTVMDLLAGTMYYWRVNGINAAGHGASSEAWQFSTAEFSTIDQNSSSIPEHFMLLPCSPNPFNPATSITYHLSGEAEMSLVIYSSSGQCVKRLVWGRKPAGRYTVKWDGRDNSGIPVTSGLYICCFQADNLILTQKMLFIQ